jgi:transposase InsO family protein
VAIMDWYSRYVLAWAVSVTLDSSFCLSALERALVRAQLNRSTRDWYTQPAAASVCSIAILASAAVTAGS